MDKEKLFEDFNQLYFALQSHPFLIDFPEKAEEFHELYSQQLITISDYPSFLKSMAGTCVLTLCSIPESVFLYSNHRICALASKVSKPYTRYM